MRWFSGRTVGIITTSDQSCCANDSAYNTRTLKKKKTLEYRAKEENPVAFYKGKCVPKEIMKAPVAHILQKRLYKALPKLLRGIILC